MEQKTFYSLVSKPCEFLYHLTLLTGILPEVSLQLLIMSLMGVGLEGISRLMIPSREEIFLHLNYFKAFVPKFQV